MSKYYQTIINKSKLKHPEKYVGKDDDIVIRSSWELMFVKKCDSNDKVLEWSSEDFCIPYKTPYDKNMHRYFPDAYVKMETSNGKIYKFVVEIKPLKDCPYPYRSKQVIKEAVDKIKQRKRKEDYLMILEKNRYKWAAAKEWCAKKGYYFKVVTEKDLNIIR